MLLLILASLSAAFILVPVVRATRSVIGGAGLVASLALAAFLVSHVAGVPGMLIAYGRRIITSLNRSQILYVGEGINSSIAISKLCAGCLSPIFETIRTGFPVVSTPYIPAAEIPIPCCPRCCFKRWNFDP